MTTLDEARAAIPEVTEVCSEVANVIYVGPIVGVDFAGFALQVVLLGPPRRPIPEQINGVQLKVRVIQEHVYLSAD